VPYSTVVQQVTDILTRISSPVHAVAVVQLHSYLSLAHEVHCTYLLASEDHDQQRGVPFNVRGSISTDGGNMCQEGLVYDHERSIRLACNCENYDAMLQ